MLVSVRRSMDVGKLSPKQRPLPPLPPQHPPPSIPPLSLPSSPPLKATSHDNVIEAEVPLSPTLQPRKPLPTPPTPKKPTIIARTITSPEISSPSPLSSSPSSNSLSSSNISTSSPNPSPLHPHFQELKKANKHHSSPELVITMKDGVVQRHLSAPSNMIDTQLNVDPDNDTRLQRYLIFHLNVVFSFLFYFIFLK